MRNVLNVLSLILCVAMFGTSMPLQNETCSLSRLKDTLPFRATIGYAITADCHLHLFRSWPDGERLSFPQKQYRQMPCGNESSLSVIHFVHRRHQMPPILVVITRLVDGEYALLELDLERLLGDRPSFNMSLKEEMELTTTKLISTKSPISTCTFVEAQLFCYWIGDNRQDVFQQKFALDEKTNKFRVEGKSIAFDKASIRHLSNKVLTSVWDQPAWASVFLYDSVTKGWLYRISNQSFLSSGQKRKNMHHIHSVQGKMIGLASMDKTILMATECDRIEGCRYYINFLQISAFSPHACVFHSDKPLTVGLLTDVRNAHNRTDFYIPEPERLISARIKEDYLGYEPIIALAVIVVVSVSSYLIVALAHESQTSEVRLSWEQRMDMLWLRYVEKSAVKSTSEDKQLDIV